MGQHTFEAARPGECCKTVLPNELKFNAKPTQLRRPVRNAWLFIGRFNSFKSDGQEKSTEILISWQELKNKFLSFFVHRQLLG